MSHRIAIIGGGASGALTFVNLVAETRVPLNIHWFDPHDALATGVAYGTHDPAHLLNVPAGKMGGLAGKPEHFLEWLQEHHPHYRAEDFVPRMLYGHYLKQLVHDARNAAQHKSITLRVHHETVTDIEVEAGALYLHAERNLVCEACVIATGNAAPTPQNDALPAWHAALPELPADAHVALIGTGLTMVDTVLSLHAQGFSGRITALSRRGLLPAAHKPCAPYPAWGWVTHPESAPKTTLGLLNGLRHEVRAAQKQGFDWRSVVDSLRAATPALWRQLPAREQQKFFRRLFTFWNIHRHRMAPEAATQLAALQQSGQLHIEKMHARDVEQLKSDLTLDCTGPSYAPSAQPLHQALIARGLARAHPSGYGISLSPAAPLFAIGAPNIGETLECTAIPELREHASQLAKTVLQRLDQEAT